MKDLEAIRSALHETFKPKSDPNSCCAICGRKGGNFSMHMLEASIPESGRIPPRFLPMAHSRGMIRGSFPICTTCAQPCAKCGMGIPGRKFAKALTAIKATAPGGVIVSAGNGMCQHMHLAKFLFQAGLPKGYQSPFPFIESCEDANRPETETDGIRAEAIRRARVRQMAKDSNRQPE